MSSFPDTPNHWAAPFIQMLRDRRIVNGFPDGTFRPDRPMTRAEYAVILQAALQQPQKRSYTPFVDVDANFWATPAIIWAYETNFLSGFPGGRFRPQANVTRIQIIVSLVSGLRVHTLVDQTEEIAPLEKIYRDAASVPQYGRAALSLATRAQLVVNYPDLRYFHPTRAATRAEVAAFFYQSLRLLGQVEEVPSDYIVELFPPGPIRSGTRISVNGKSRAATWNQWSDGVDVRTAIADTGLMQSAGVELLNTNDETQPVRWFSPTVSLTPQLQNPYRHLEITQWRKKQSWTMVVEEETLVITTPVPAIESIATEDIRDRNNSELIGMRVTITLSQPATYQLRQDTFEWKVTVDGTASADILEQFSNPEDITTEEDRPSSEEVNEGEVEGESGSPLRPMVTAQENQTTIEGNLPPGISVTATTDANPYRLILELRPDPVRDRQILWLPGLQWQQRYLELENDRFPTTWLTLSATEIERLHLEPIWTYASTMKGTTPLLKMGEYTKCSAAINAGFFNRNNLLPLGAIRWRGTWYSGPILTRGAIAWDNKGNYAIDRLVLEETLITPAGARLPLIALNSGYVKGGISRYTPEWGKTYSPLAGGEIIIVVEDNVIVRHIDAPEETEIPSNGYLLVLRSLASARSSLTIGLSLTLEQQTNPIEFNSFPHIIGGGPLLVKNREIIADAQAEGFSAAFANQSAIRSVFGITESGDFLLTTIHNRIGGRGPSLTETARLIQQLGAIHALNLDGGSSTSLILGGHTINRPASTAARVHNGLGIFHQEE